jgi:hypothetical protein
MKWFFLAVCLGVVGCEQSQTVGDCSGEADEAKAPFVVDGGDASNAANEACEPGAAAVCDCDDHDAGPNLGKKYCSWDGVGYGACELCGEGPAYMVETAIGCNQTPPSGFGDPPLAECPGTAGVCWGYQCDNLKKVCVQVSFVEGSVLQDLSPNDCHEPTCDGAGNVVLTPAPNDCNGACDGVGLCVP